MLSIMLATTAIMLQVIHNFNYYISIVRFNCVFYIIYYVAMLLYLTYYVHEKTCASFCNMLP